MDTRHITSIVILLALACCAHPGSTPRRDPGGPYYFSSWNHYYQPSQPVGEVSAEVALEIESYAICYFDEHGRLEKSVYVLHGAPISTQTREYPQEGMVIVSSTMETGWYRTIYMNGRVMSEEDGRDQPR